MNEKKLKLATIGTIVGAFVLVIAMVLVWKFRFYDVVVSELDDTNSQFDTQKATADKLEASLKAALLSQQRLALAQGELAYFRTRYRSLPFDLTTSPTVGQGPLNATFVRYLNEYASGFGLNARAQLLRAADESGVQIATEIKVEAPPQNPEQVALPQSGFLKPQGGPLNVTITGTLPSILNFFQIINRSEILMVVGTVKMEGLSPAIKATFTITPYLLASGESATPEASVAAIPGINEVFTGAATAAPAGGAPGEGGAPGDGPPGDGPPTDGPPADAAPADGPPA